MHYEPVITRRSITEDARRSIARALADHYHELGEVEGPSAPRFSLARLLQQMGDPSGGGLCDGYEKEVCSAAATAAGEVFDRHRVLLPLSRDLSAAAAASGGYLVSSTIPNAEPFDALRGFSVVAESGVTVLPGLVGNVTLSKVSTAAAGGWIATETTNYPTAQPVLGQAAMAVKFVAGFVNISRLMLLQAQSLEAMLRQQMFGTVGQLLDTAVLNGSGASGQPTGLLSTPGINTTSGTTLAHAGILAMRRQVLASGGRQDRLRWISTPAIQEQ